MKNRCFKGFALIVFCILGAVFFGQEGVLAAVDGKDARLAQEAYHKMLSQKKVSWGERDVQAKNLEGLVYDVDQDGIPELFLKNKKPKEGEDVLRIYTYRKKKKKVRLLMGTKDRLYVYQKQGVICTVGNQTGSNWTTYYTLENGVLTKRLYMTGTILYDMLPADTAVLEVAPGDADTIYFYTFEADFKLITREEAEKIVLGLENGNRVMDLGEYLEIKKLCIVLVPEE